MGTSHCMAQRTDLPTLTAPVLSAGGTLSARNQKERCNLERSSATQSLSFGQRPRTPLPPPSPLGKGPKWSLVCALWTLSPYPAAPLRSRDVPGETRSLDGRSSFPNRKYSPSESESANNICNTSSQYNFLLVIWRFSLTNLTIYSHAMNWTASASMTR